LKKFSDIGKDNYYSFFSIWIEDL